MYPAGGSVSPRCCAWGIQMPMSNHAHVEGEPPLVLILLNYYVVINTKKGEIESASSPIIYFGINDNIII